MQTEDQLIVEYFVRSSLALCPIVAIFYICVSRWSKYRKELILDHVQRNEKNASVEKIIQLRNSIFLVTMHSLLLWVIIVSTLASKMYIVFLIVSITALPLFWYALFQYIDHKINMIVVTGQSLYVTSVFRMNKILRFKKCDLVSASEVTADFTEVFLSKLIVKGGKSYFIYGASARERSEFNKIISDTTMGACNGN